MNKISGFSSSEYTGITSYYDESKKKIGWSEGSYNSRYKTLTDYSEHAQSTISNEYNPDCTYYDTNNNIIAYSDGTECSKNFYDENKKYVGTSRSELPSVANFYDTEGNFSGQRLGEYSKIFYGSIPFLDKMLSVSKEMEEKSIYLVNAILTSPNESEATKKVNALLKNCVNEPAALNNYVQNTTPLFAAIKKGYLSSAELLLASGATPNSWSNTDGFTPLTKVVHENNTKFIELLVKNGARIERRDHRGLSPLHYARENANRDMVSFLRSKGARRCWLHEFLGKGDELKGFEKKESYLTKKMWVGVADNHSLLNGIGAVIATPFTGLLDACTYSYKIMKSLFRSSENAILSKSLNQTQLKDKDIDLTITKNKYSPAKSQDKKLTIKTSIQREYSPGNRPGGYSIKNAIPVFPLKKSGKEMAL